MKGRFKIFLCIDDFTSARYLIKLAFKPNRRLGIHSNIPMNKWMFYGCLRNHSTKSSSNFIRNTFIGNELTSRGWNFLCQCSNCQYLIGMLWTLLLRVSYNHAFITKWYCQICKLMWAVFPLRYYMIENLPLPINSFINNLRLYVNMH